MQIVPGDSVTLAGGNLSASLLNGFTPAGSNVFDIVQPGSGTLTGDFAGLPEGSTVVGSNGLFSITYQGGAGHDVALTCLPSAVWTGGGDDSHWSDGNNWASGSAPGSGDSLIFPALNGNPPQTLTDDLGDGTSFGLISISGSNYTLSGSNVVLSDGLFCSGSGNTVDLNIALAANQQIANNSGKLILGGNIDLGGCILTIDGSGYETDLNGIISGSGGLIDSSSGRAVFAGPNTYQGTTQVLSGVLAVSSDTALGAGDDAADEGVALGNNANLELDGPLTIANKLLTISGSSSYTDASLESYAPSGVNDWTGGVNFTGAGEGNTYLYVYAFSGSLEIDGTIAGGGNSDLVADSGPITLEGAGSSVGYFQSGAGSSIVLDGSLSASNGFYDGGGTTIEVDGALATPSSASVYGTLSGIGTVVATNAMYIYGQVAPGTASGPGTLAVGNLIFENGSSLDAQIASGAL